ncbi:MAG: hypothetical protein K8W52_04500 [Deltaproteobacteria bacterium]|nr:hypothetical protein [Deltaproteobacteria bacterium]
MEIAYLTDVEGSWDKLASFARDNPRVALDGDALRLADGVTFVFGGDAIDRGPHARRIVATLLAARRTYGDRVILLAGNRDLNKLRLVRELDGAPPTRAPAGLPRAELLRWILANTMGAARAFEHRATELAAGGHDATDDAVVRSFLDDVNAGGALRTYLGECRLGYRAGATLFLHGGITAANLGVTPGAPRAEEVDGWLAALDRFYREGLAEFAATGTARALIAYQAPLPGTSFNQSSVVYARPTDADANPLLPEPRVIAQLRASGIGRLIVGHTPSGDCPAILRDDDGFELVLADNSYGRVEAGSQVAITDDAITVRATTQLDDGARLTVDHIAVHGAASPLGRRDRATGQLVKARLADDRYLLFRGLPERRVEQVAISAAELGSRALIAPRT